jgi:hypothetical protein
VIDRRDDLAGRHVGDRALDRMAVVIEVHNELRAPAAA